MLGYEASDIDDMVEAIQTVLKTIDTDTYLQLHTNLWKAQDFLQGLWAEGYLD
jgi:hypothetical protein